MAFGNVFRLSTSRRWRARLLPAHSSGDDPYQQLKEWMPRRRLSIGRSDSSLNRGSRSVMALKGSVVARGGESTGGRTTFSGRMAAFEQEICRPTGTRRYRQNADLTRDPSLRR